MHRLALALCLLAPAAAAQPTAADSALVERLLTALRFDLAGQVMGEMADGVEAEVGAQSPEAAGFVGSFMGAFADMGPVVDSVRAAYLADLRPDLAREALAFLEGPVMARVIEESPFLPGQFDYAEMMALLEDPGSRPLADSALAARYATALTAANQPPHLQQRMAEALWGAFPPDARRTIDETVGKAQFLEMTQASQTNPEQQALMVRAARLSLGELSDDEIEAVTAYYESEAGRYVSGRAAVGATNAYLPRMIEAVRPAFKALAAQAAQPGPSVERRKGTGGGLSAPDVFEVAEVQPELIGGLEGLQQSVEYPEAARRAGVEGRVIVQFVVDERGRVVDPVVVRSPSPLLSDAALDAVRQARFRPGSDAGEAVKVRFALPITFRLRDDPPEVEGPVVEEIDLDLDAPPAGGAPEERTVREEAPRLIGGLAGLAGRTVYPEDARRESVEGRVVVQFVVTEEGRVESPVVLSSPDPRLSRAALAAVRQSRFEPGRIDGQPVRVRFALPVDFSLR